MFFKDFIQIYEYKIIAGTDTTFSFDYVFGAESQQVNIYDDCVTDLIDAAFEGNSSPDRSYSILIVFFFYEFNKVLMQRF